MANTLVFESTDPLKIDLRKRKIESSFLRRIKSILKNISIDAESLFLSNGNLDASQLANNYRADFIKEIRDIYRKTIKEFGFSVRSDLKSLGFHDEEYQSSFDFCIKQNVSLSSEGVSSSLKDLNSSFINASVLFIANESESQVDLITRTNEKDISNSVIISESLYQARQQNLISERDSLSQDAFFAEGVVSDKARRKIESLDREIENNRINKTALVANLLGVTLLDKAESRAKLINEQNVGLAESFSRSKEAELVDDQGFLKEDGEKVVMIKEWVSILDSRTRDAHVIADGQIVLRADKFIVDGELLDRPLDPSGSPGNIIRCRCVAMYSIKD